MTTKDWLEARRPPAPEGLAAWLGPRVDGAEPAGGAEGDVGATLRARAFAALDRARTAPGRSRDSAWWLLAADALLTYACEAALEGNDPDACLERLLLDACSTDRE